MNFSARSRLHLYGLLTREVPVAQITKGSGTVTEYMPGLVDKALFLKTPYALVTGHRERKLRNLEVPSSLAGLHSVERCLGKKCLFIYGRCMLQHQYLPSGTIWHNYYGYNHSFLIKFKTCLTRRNACLVL